MRTGKFSFTTVYLTGKATLSAVRSHRTERWNQYLCLCRKSPNHNGRSGGVERLVLPAPTWPPGTQGPLLFNHQYLCVTRADGSVSCGGLTTDGNPLSGEPHLTRPDEDYYDRRSCKEVDDDKEQCFEQCVLRNFAKPSKPRYGIGPLTDCQEYADDLYYGCKILCNIHRGRQ